MSVNLCMCGKEDARRTDVCCQSCWEIYYSELFFNAVGGVGTGTSCKYLQAIANVRAAHPDFDELEPAWGL